MTEPRIAEIRPPPDPFEACARLADLDHCLLLESLPGFGRLGRHSFLTADPFLALRSKDGAVEVAGPGESCAFRADPFHVLRERLERFPVEPVLGLPPFQGGVGGAFAYDLCHHLERLPAPRHDDLRLPDLDVGFYDWVLAWDHQEERAWILSTGLPEEASRRERRAARRLRFVQGRLAGPARAPSKRPATPRPRPDGRSGGPPRHPVVGRAGVAATFTRDGYEDAVRRASEYILAGDIFQVNLSQRLSASWRSHPFDLYGRLRRVNPTPFAAYLQCGPARIVGASPERFLRLRDGRVETRPIKGTRPRGYTPEHDMALDLSLRSSEKDRAENVMIVDLLRNDLSRVCRDGSVQAPEICEPEHYATVHHLVSTVVGELRPGLGAVDLLQAAFPGGSVTGAPKVRAMEIIAELEPTRRSVYCGAVGYLGFDGSLDTNIAIRTFILPPGAEATFQVGGAVVADSDPAREYEETLDKAQGLLAALDGVRGRR